MSVSLVIDSPPNIDTKTSVGGVHLEYRPDIDGLRAIAVLAVMGVHAGWLRGGAAGVDVFFVISGFLISGIILRTIKTGSFSLLGFYARRVKRIFPALLVFLLAVWGMGWLILSPQYYSVLGADIAAGAGFVENLWFYSTISRRNQTSDFLLTHLWSLGIEEQFYLVWPIFLWALARLQRGQLVLIVTVTIFSFACFVWTIPRDGAAAWMLPWNRLWELSMGGALAYAQSGEHLEFQRAPATTAVRLQPSGLLNLPVGHTIATLGVACLASSLSGLIPLNIMACFTACIRTRFVSTDRRWSAVLVQPICAQHAGAGAHRPV